jgi:hypothetical protein
LKPLFEVLYSLNKGQPNNGQWVIACLQGAWSKILGERLAAVCRPAAFEKSDLQIEILDPGWDQAIESVKAALLEKLRTATANEVKSISFSRHPAAGNRH